MNNPFPGMNPFLEDPAFWGDFHQTFIGAWREQIADLLPDHYEARINEYVCLVDEVPEDRKRAGPDIAVIKERKRRKTKILETVSAATLAPVTIPVLLLDEERQAHIEILHRPKRNLVAVLELLSPGNKENPGRRVYLTKRNELLQQSVHLVELDLLLHGQRLPLAEPLPPGDYYYLVSDCTRSPDCDVYAWMLPQPLPVVPVPLLAPDRAILGNLGAALATAFQRGRYDRVLEYRNNPRVHLAAEQLRWSRQQIRAVRAKG